MVYYFLFLSIFFQLTLYGGGFLHPVDISFLVADVKYSQERGVQICEIQHGTDSTFFGEAFSNGNKSLIAENFVNYFARFDKSVWIVLSDIHESMLRVELHKRHFWEEVERVNQLRKNRDFVEKSSLQTLDPEKISGCNGFVIGKYPTIKKLDRYLESSSVILMDRALLPICRDKYKASLLLETCKPQWGLYPKEYTPDLANRICRDIEATRYVIKPRGEFCGRGVVIVDKEDLDQTLKYIFSKSQELAKDPDRAYRTWYKEKSDTFLVEEFARADPVVVPHLESKSYCPTIRIVFLAIYEQGDTDIHFLGGYNCLPEKALSEDGSLHEIYKASLKTIHSSQLDPDTYARVTGELYEPLRRFYMNVINFED